MTTIFQYTDGSTSRYLIFYRKQVPTGAGHLDMDIIPSIPKLSRMWNRNFSILKKVCLSKGVDTNRLALVHVITVCKKNTPIDNEI